MLDCDDNDDHHMSRLDLLVISSMENSHTWGLPGFLSHPCEIELNSLQAR